MNKVKSLCSTACVTLLLLAGCAETQRYEAVEQICVPDTNRAEATRTAEDILSQMHFVIDKADPDRGFISTRPLPGAQFFEFWRSDSVGPFNSAEANLHTIRRTVELNIAPQGQQLCIACNVNVQRLSLPEHPVSSSSRAYEMFSRSTAKMQRLRLRPEQKEKMAWLDLGNDTELATLILNRIEEQIVTQGRSPVSQTSHESPATRDKK